ncbi:MMPL family transporter [Methylosinus sporium]|uniref:MMPL family transporter n=1 Tax=Methylosinus sporium TaxID=428 RepID=A0A549SZP1_METSR|nr:MULTISPECIES: efflux RND transporter permease subunit [Methylosinus]MBU3890757.1 efflux RND transporter permease subunit [Methylosinus sp. KRF6]TRL35076.1 MMPL family transporter [Methylosinus sporium]
MNISAPFVERPVATTLLTIAIALVGALAVLHLPAAPMPEFDYPAISVRAQMPGASPEVMATTVAAPLERRLGMIADVSEIRSFNSSGSTVVALTFGVGRNIDGAARDVQAAVAAARADLPISLRSNPLIFKSNSAFWPITYLSLSSTTMSVDRVYDVASTVLQPLLASIQGVGEVVVLGSSPLAVRVEIDPDALSKYGVELESVRAALAAANANSPKGVIESDGRRFQIYANDRVSNAVALRDLIIAYHEDQAIRLSDVAEVIDSVEDFRPFAITGRQASILVRVYRTSGANVVETVDRIKARLEQIRAALPPAIAVEMASDRTATIRASLRDLGHSLVIGAVLVILVVLAFLRSLRATFPPAIAAIVSLLGTGAVMHVMRYSLDSVSLMALIIAVGLVIDDSVIVLENISRHVERGEPLLRAVLRGVDEVGFTVVAISLSLVAIFIPFLLMGDLMGRVLAEFAVTLSTAVMISLVVSLTTTPMLCSIVLSRKQPRRAGAALEAIFQRVLAQYDRTLDFALRHSQWTLAAFFAALGLSVYLYAAVPKGLLPQQDPGRLYGVLLADQNVSAAAMRRMLERAAELISADPSVASFAAVIEDGARRNSAELYVELKPRPGRVESCQDVNARLTKAISNIAGATLRLVAPQDIAAFSAPANRSGQYHYDLRGDDLAEVQAWALRLTAALTRAPQIRDADVDPRPHALETVVTVDRDKAERLGVDMRQVDNVLYDAFGQRQVSTMYGQLNQYHIVMEAAPRFRESPDVLNRIYVSPARGLVGGVQFTNAPIGTIVAETNGAADPGGSSAAADVARNQRANAIAHRAGGAVSTGAAVSTQVASMIPLSSIARFEQKAAPLVVTHVGGSAAVSVSFNLPPNVALGDAVAAIERTAAEIHMPASIQSGFSGAAAAFQKVIVQEGILAIVAIAVIYIILGILYESFIHPMTVLSTLPSAGLGAILTLTALRIEFTVIAFIGVILLTGIVKKNAIMMIDVAIRAQRQLGLSAHDAIRHACVLRFRPITMTTVATIFGAAPLALGGGDGAEFRQPLGIAVIGGLVVSQALTLYTTPVVYLYLDRLVRRGGRSSESRNSAMQTNP